MSRYRKYRKIIKSMSDDEFGEKKETTTLEEDVRAAEAAIKPSRTPYELFRNHRIRVWTIRVASSLLLIGAMLAWFYFLRGRM